VALEFRHDLARHFVGVITGMVEFEVGNRARRAADRLAIHSTDKTQKRFCSRKVTENVVALVVECRPADLDQPDIIGPAIEAQLAEPGGVEHLRGRGPLIGRLMKAAYRGMFGEIHDGTWSWLEIPNCRVRWSGLD